ncbi:MAG: hypothetical protein FWD90_04950 [Defluviitaleaceae bacterium]|nr:hypothetical protein [Defluviitaleaceae bacterium]
MGWLEEMDKKIDRIENKIFDFIDDPIGTAAKGVQQVIYGTIYEIGALFGLKGLFGIRKLDQNGFDQNGLKMINREEYNRLRAPKGPAKADNETTVELKKINEKLKGYETFINETREAQAKARREELAKAPLPEIPKTTQPKPLYSQEKANAPLPEIPQPTQPKPLYSQEKANAPLPEIPQPTQPKPLYSQEKANAPLPEIPQSTQPKPLYSQEKANAPLPEIPKAQGRENKPLPPVPESKAKDGKPLPQIPGRQPMSEKDLDNVVKKSDVKPLNLPSWQNKDKVPLNKDGRPMTLSERLNLPGRNTYNSKKLPPSEPKKDEPAKEKAPAPMLPKKKK